MTEKYFALYIVCDMRVLLDILRWWLHQPRFFTIDRIDNRKLQAWYIYWCNFDWCSYWDITNVEIPNWLDINKSFCGRWDIFIDAYRFAYNSEFFWFISSMICKTSFYNDKRFDEVYSRISTFLFPHSDIVHSQLHEKLMYVEHRKLIKWRLSKDSFMPWYSDKSWWYDYARYIHYKYLSQSNSNNKIAKFFLILSYESYFFYILVKCINYMNLCVLLRWYIKLKIIFKRLRYSPIELD